MALSKGTLDEVDLRARLAAICGPDKVFTDSSDLSFFASDLYQSGPAPVAVVSPQTPDQVADLVKLARRHHVPIHVRGGGMSYSNAFLPEKADAILLDMTGLNRVRAISTDDLFVTVESGATWRALDDALAPHGLRAVFCGPASGQRATIGGSMSQGTANQQSGQIETSSNAVLSYEIVTGTGDILRTGLDAQTGRLPNYRPYGPDITALFNADSGALGIKTAVTLKLEPRPQAEGGVSFAFADIGDMLKAMQAAGRTGLASTTIAMDSETAGIRSGERGLAADIKKLVTIVRTAHNPLRGVARGLRIAVAGRRVFDTAKYTAHFLVTTNDTSTLASKERGLRKAVADLGDEIPAAAISLMHADRFPNLPTTDFTGRRLLPIHGILAWSRAGAAHQAYSQLVEHHAADLEAQKVTIAEVFTGIGPSSLLFEPVFYWQDSLTDFHKRTRPDTLPRLDTQYPNNPKARALVERLKTRIIEIFSDHGAAHIQIGKLYPFMNDRDNSNASLLRQMKTVLDPDNIINPGALGLIKKETSS